MPRPGRAVAALAVLLAATLAGCTGPGATDAPPLDAPRAGSDGERRGPPPAPEAQVFRGNGDGRTPSFDVRYPVLRVRAEHAGSGPFTVRLLEIAGQEYGRIARSGTYEGERHFSVPPLTFYFRVEGAGAWTVNVEQQAPAEGATLPRTLEGRGDAAPPALHLPNGGVRFDLEHTGDGPAAFRLLGIHGRKTTDLASGATAFEKEVVVDLEHAGYYFLDVESTGRWKVTAAADE